MSKWAEWSSGKPWAGWKIEHWVSGALSIVFVLIVFGLIAWAALMPRPANPGIQIAPGLYRYADVDQGVICYVFAERALDCVEVGR